MSVDGVYIKNMEMPPAGCILIVFPSGRVLKVSSDQTQNIYGEAEAVPVPPHGRCIDADLLCKVLQKNSEDEWNNKTAPFSWAYAYDCVKDTVENMPTVIPAEEGEA